MKKPGFLRKIIMVVGLLVLMVTGYGATSVMTCKEAEAQCICGICVYIGQGLISVLAQVASGIVIPAIGAAAQFVIAYLGLAFLAFTEQVVEKFWTVSYNFVSWFDAFQAYNLVPSMQQQARQLNTADADQARAWSGFSDAEELNRTRKELANMEAEALSEYKPGENVCVAATVVGGMAKAEAIRRAYATAAPQKLMARNNRSKTSPGGGSAPAADKAQRWSDVVNRYCDPAENNGAAGCATPGPRVNQDIDVTGMLFEKETIDVTDPEVQKTIDDLIANIANPFMNEPVSKGAVQSAAGQQAALAGEADKAKRQTAIDALYYHVSNRVPGSNTQNFIKQIGAAAGLSAVEMSENPSTHEIMQTMTDRRFSTGTYAIEQIDEPANNDREMVIQNAFQVMQLSRELDILDHYSFMLAAEAGSEVQKTRPLRDRVDAMPVR